MRWPVLLILLLVAVLQYPLWLGKGGWFRVWEADRELAEQKALNHTLEQRNAGLDAEIAAPGSGSGGRSCHARRSS